MKIITISGMARHGKDSSAKFIRKKLEELGKKVLIIHYADYLKFICKEYFGWNGEKDEAGRTLLQYIGTEKIRNKNTNFHVEVIRLLIEVIGEDFDYIIIPDTRFPNEIQELIKYGFDVLSLKVIRDDFDSELTLEQKKHPSETALNNYHFDSYITAVDLDDLKQECEMLVSSMNQHNVF